MPLRRLVRVTATTSRASSPSRFPPLIFSILSLLGFLTVYLLAVHTPRGQAIENRALDASTYDHPGGLLSLVTVPYLVLAVVVLAVLALLTGRRRGLIRVVVIVGVPNALAQLLKHQVFFRPDLADAASANTFPSGHAVAYASVLLALLIAAPAPIRGIVAVLSVVLVSVVAYQLLAYGWHRASDVVGGLLLAAGISALMLYALPDRRREHSALMRTLTLSTLIGGSALALALALLAAGGLASGLSQARGSALLLLASQCLAVFVVGGVFTVVLVLRSRTGSRHGEDRRRRMRGPRGVAVHRARLRLRE